MEESNAERRAFSPRRLKALITAVRGSCRAAEKLSCLRCRARPPASGGVTLCPFFTNRKQWLYYTNQTADSQEFHHNFQVIGQVSTAPTCLALWERCPRRGRRGPAQSAPLTALPEGEPRGSVRPGIIASETAIFIPQIFPVNWKFIKKGFPFITQCDTMVADATRKEL